MMSKQLRYGCIVVVILPAMLICNTAFGWSGTTHEHLCEDTFADPVVAPLAEGLGLNIGYVTGYIGEPPGNWHDQQWTDIRDRAYVEGAGAPNENNWWGSLDEKNRLQYLSHNTTDVAVPLGHSPARDGSAGYVNNYAEDQLEILRVGNWPSSDYPSIVGTTYYTHTVTGATYDFDGTIGEIVSKFESACRDNMSWFKSTKYGAWIPDPLLFPFHWIEVQTHSGDNYREAGWNGLKLGLILQRAVLVDYMLARESPVADAGGDHFVRQGETEYFNASNSYDPDSVTWSSNGTYHNNGGGITYYWDYNFDGIWDWVDNDPYDQRTYEQLGAMGIQSDRWFRYNFAIQDDEGKWSYDSDWLYLSSDGSIIVPEPATLSLLAVGGLALLRRRKK